VIMTRRTNLKNFFYAGDTVRDKSKYDVHAQLIKEREEKEARERAEWKRNALRGNGK